MSSIRPDIAARLAETGKAAAVRVMDAPVSGGETGAIEGTLSIMVGAQREDFEEVKSILDTMGTTVVLVGPPGSGQTQKAANQLTSPAPSNWWPRRSCSSGRTAWTPRRPSLCWPAAWPETKSWSERPPTCSQATSRPASGSTCIGKDMGIVTAAAREREVVIPLGALTAELVAAVRAQGDGHLDHSALLRGVERLSGQRVS